tara:strand:+ start:20299 stop:20667 length:369 start_codon:yes stop_codon:yes gene_type:complete
MANTFKVITHTGMAASAGTPETLYTVPSSTTTVVIGLTLCNILTSSVLIDVRLDSSTSNSGGGTNVSTGDGIHIAKDVPIAVGSSLELLSGGKYVLQTGDILKIDSNVNGAVDVCLNIMEIT